MPVELCAEPSIGALIKDADEHADGSIAITGCSERQGAFAQPLESDTGSDRGPASDVDVDGVHPLASLCVGPNVEGSHEGGLVAAGLWLKHWMPLILDPPAYRAGRLVAQPVLDAVVRRVGHITLLLLLTSSS